MAYTNFKPDIWAEIVERNFRQATILGALFTDLSAKIATEGKTIQMPSFTKVTVKRLGSDGKITTEKPADGKQVFNIDKQDYFSVQVDDVDQAQISQDLKAIFTDNGVYEMALAFDTELAKLYTKSKAITAVNLNTSGAKISTALYKLAAEMSKANIPKAGRWLVIDPMTHARLLEELPTLSSGTDAAFSNIVNGKVGALAGFTIFESNSIISDTTTVSGKTTMHCIAGVKASGAYATQLSKLRAITVEDEFADRVEGLHVYGVDVFETDLSANKTDKLQVLQVTLP